MIQPLDRQTLHEAPFGVDSWHQKWQKSVIKSCGMWDIYCVLGSFVELYQHEAE
jgi:hypothetical protein